MKFACENCGTRYNIADEKVRHKVLKIRCRVCENVITVRGADLGRQGSDPPPDQQEPDEDGPAAAAQNGWFAAPAGEEVGPVPLERLKAMVEVGDVGPDDLVWCDGMPDWLPVSEVPELMRHLPRMSHLDDEATSTFELHDRIDDSLRHMLLGTPPVQTDDRDTGRIGWESPDDRPTLAEQPALPSVPMGHDPMTPERGDGQRKIIIAAIVVSLVVLLGLVGVATWWFSKQSRPVAPADPAPAAPARPAAPAPAQPAAPAPAQPAAPAPAQPAPAEPAAPAAPAETLTQDQVNGVIDGQKAAIAQCRETHLGGKAPARPEMMLTFEIRPTGRTANPAVGKPFAGTPFGDCIVAAAREWRFPQFTGAPMPVEYPLVLEAAGSE